jgi:Na+/H+ antiporter NhaD/arsenite permease-like protein
VTWVILALFVLTYAGIAARRLHALPIGRPAVALVGACALVAAGSFAGERGLSAEEALAAVDMDTLALLFGMMVVSAGLAEAGFFAWSARWLARRVRSHAALLWAVTIGSGLLSAVLVNDAICLLATPLLVRVAAQLGAAQRPLLYAIAMGANAGSALTLSGNPQNMLVAKLSELTYRGYLLEAAAPGLVALVLTAATLHLLHRRELAAAPAEHELPEEPRLDRPLLVTSLLALGGIVAANVAGASLAGSALVGASVVLIAARLRAESLLHQVDWSVLLFFAGLFVVVAALQRTGLPATWLEATGAASTTSVLALVLVLTIGSQIVSNVPLILLLAPWIAAHPDPGHAWTLTALTTTLAGNLTLLGSVANILVVERARAHLGFFEYLRVGVPVTVVSLGAALAVYLALW